MLVDMNVLTNHVVHHTLYLTQLLVSHLLEVREVETQRVGAHERTLLLYMVAQHLLQCIVQQVGCRMVGSRCITLVCIYTSHELSRWVFGQLLDDVYALVVLALGVDNLDSLVLVHQYTAVTYLSTHLSVERSGIEHQFIELVLFLCHLAIAQDMAVVFCIVVAHELLFASLQFYPVAVFNGSSVTGTLLLFLHLHVELLFIYREAVLATNQLCQVEGESVGVEQTESLYTIQLTLTLSLQFVHSIIQHRNTLVEGTQERIFLFLDHLGNQCLLRLQFGEGVAHLVNQCGNELIEETFLLSEECVGIAHCTAQNATNHVASLGIRRQLSVGN